LIFGEELTIENETSTGYITEVINPTTTQYRVEDGYQILMTFFDYLIKTYSPLSNRTLPIGKTNKELQFAMQEVLDGTVIESTKTQKGENIILKNYPSSIQNNPDIFLNSIKPNHLINFEVETKGDETHFVSKPIKETILDEEVVYTTDFKGVNGNISKTKMHLILGELNINGTEKLLDTDKVMGDEDDGISFEQYEEDRIEDGEQNTTYSEKMPLLTQISQNLHWDGVEMDISHVDKNNTHSILKISNLEVFNEIGVSFKVGAVILDVKQKRINEKTIGKSTLIIQNFETEDVKIGKITLTGGNVSGINDEVLSNIQTALADENNPNIPLLKATVQTIINKGFSFDVGVKVENFIQRDGATVSGDTKGTSFNFVINQGEPTLQLKEISFDFNITLLKNTLQENTVQEMISQFLFGDETDSNNVINYFLDILDIHFTAKVAGGEGMVEKNKVPNQLRFPLTILDNFDKSIEVSGGVNTNGISFNTKMEILRKK
jgi:hypothetical protein